MSSKSATPSENLLDELQTTLAHGTVARRVETLRRVTDLFINSAVDYSDEQIALFDDVFQCLIAAHRDLGQGAARQPPRADRHRAAADHPRAGVRRSDRGRRPGAVAIGAARRRRADRDRAQQEPGASDGDLDAEGVERRGDRRAGAARQRRGGPEHRQTIPARNSPSTASPGWSRAPRATTISRPASACGRPMPRHHYLKLIAKASATVRARLEAANPQLAGDVPAAVQEATRRARSRAVRHHAGNRQSRTRWSNHCTRTAGSTSIRWRRLPKPASSTKPMRRSRRSPTCRSSIAENMMVETRAEGVHDPGQGRRACHGRRVKAIINMRDEALGHRAAPILKPARRPTNGCAPRPRSRCCASTACSRPLRPCRRRERRLLQDRCPQRIRVRIR